MRLHERVTATWEVVSSDASESDSLLLVNSFFGKNRAIKRSVMTGLRKNRLQIPSYRVNTFFQTWTSTSEHPLPIATPSVRKHLMQGYLQRIRQYSFYTRVWMSNSVRENRSCVPMCFGKTLQGHTTRFDRSFYLVWSHKPLNPIRSTSNMFFYGRR